MLANMQEGMRGYFDELSKQRSFRGIQEVLVKEINNSDSKKICDIDYNRQLFIDTKKL